MVKTTKQPTLEQGGRRLRMPPGTDEVNQGGDLYRVALGPAEEEGTVTVPVDVAEHLIRQGGAVEVDVSPPDLPTGFIHVRHVTDPKASFGWCGVAYLPDEDGKIHAPIASLEAIAGHGFLPC